MHGIGYAMALAATSMAAAPLAAQAGGLGSLLGNGGVPSLSGVGAGNAAGMLSYCVKNKLLGSATSGGAGGLLGRVTGVQPTPTPSPSPMTSQSAAQSVLGRLLGRKEVTASPGFAAGQAGQLQLGGNRTLPVTSLTDQVKGRLCSVVLQRAGSFL